VVNEQALTQRTVIRWPRQQHDCSTTSLYSKPGHATANISMLLPGLTTQPNGLRMTAVTGCRNEADNKNNNDNKVNLYTSRVDVQWREYQRTTASVENNSGSLHSWSRENSLKPAIFVYQVCSRLSMLQITKSGTTRLHRRPMNSTEWMENDDQNT